jgi:hypothetical protein
MSDLYTRCEKCERNIEPHSSLGNDPLYGTIEGGGGRA